MVSVTTCPLRSVIITDTRTGLSYILEWSRGGGDRLIVMSDVFSYLPRIQSNHSTVQSYALSVVFLLPVSINRQIKEKNFICKSLKVKLKFCVCL